MTQVIGETVAMGLDNDCTAATAGSIVGAVVGRDGVPKRWTKRFHNTVHSYLKGVSKFAIDGLIERFAKQAKRIAAFTPLPDLTEFRRTIKVRGKSIVESLIEERRKARA